MLWLDIKSLFSGNFMICVDRNITANNLYLALKEQYEYNENNVKYIYNYKNLAKDLQDLEEKSFKSTSDVLNELLQIFEINLLEFQVDNLFIKCDNDVNGTHFEFIFYANGSFFNLCIGYSEERKELFLL